MNRVGKPFVGKRAAMIIAALFVVSAVAFTGCSGASEDAPTGAGQYSSSDREAVTDKSIEEGSKPAGDIASATDDTAQPAPDNKSEASVADTEPEGEYETLTGVSADSASASTEEESDDPAEQAVPDSILPAEKAGTGAQSAVNTSDIWDNSFLLFLPKFESGVEEDRISEETFDHVVIGGIGSKRVIEDYVEKIKTAGFNVEADYVDHNGDIDFHAYNQDGWYVKVDYDINDAKVDIACGFFDEEKNIEPGNYFTEEMLEVLPVPECGTLCGGKADGDFPYALYDGCTLDDALAYAGKLKKAGFDEEVTEGESDDLCWYNAVGPNGYICDMQYADGIIMIGCDKKEE